MATRTTIVAVLLLVLAATPASAQGDDGKKKKDDDPCKKKCFKPLMGHLLATMGDKTQPAWVKNMGKLKACNEKYPDTKTRRFLVAIEPAEAVHTTTDGARRRLKDDDACPDFLQEFHDCGWNCDSFKSKKHAADMMGCWADALK